MHACIFDDFIVNRRASFHSRCHVRRCRPCVAPTFRISHSYMSGRDVLERFEACGDPLIKRNEKTSLAEPPRAAASHTPYCYQLPNRLGERPLHIYPLSNPNKHYGAARMHGRGAAAAGIPHLADWRLDFVLVWVTTWHCRRVKTPHQLCPD